MRILQVSPSYYPSLGGIEEHVRNISERLAKEHQVVVFTGDSSGKLPREEQINGVLVKRFKTFSPSGAYHLSFEMARELRRSEFDIVHGHNYHAFPLYLCRYAKAKKFVLTPYYHGHGHTKLRDFLLKLYKPFGRKIFEDVDKIVVISNYERELLNRDFDIAEGKISVIPSGIDSPEFESLGEVVRKPRTILYVGRLEEYKGVQHIIQMLPLLNQDFRLQIVGKGPCKGKLVGLIDKLGLNDRVEFYQDLPRQELLNMYATAGVVVLLSRYESFAIVVAEALAAKTPCIVASTSALTEWVDNKNCFGIDYPIDSNKLAELIDCAIETEVTDVKLWDWGELTRQISRLYQEQLN